ncbi:MAG: zinc-ribbon and DUF3426 domain-containing protein [Candidatus Thiodiazotropha sp.]
MLTQCPHCLTLFRVGPEHLKAAAGQVRCCRCHKVFNALQSLQEAPSPFTNHDTTSRLQEVTASPGETDHKAAAEPIAEPPQETSEANDWHDFQTAQPDGDFEPLLTDLDSPESQVHLIEDILEQDDGLDPEPDYLAAGSESQMSELLDQDSSSLLLPDSEVPTEESRNGGDNIVELVPSEEMTLPEETPAESPPIEDHDAEESILTDEAIDEELGKPDYDSVPAFRAEMEAAPEKPDEHDHAINFEAEKMHIPSIKISPLWLIGSLLLVLPLAAQFAWQFRDDLIQYTAGRQTLNLICQIAGCEVPVRRALGNIVIQGRNLSSHPDKPEALFLQLSMVNTAAFEQPFPKLTLSLYNDEGNLIARRTFAAEDYLPADYTPQDLMPKGQPVLIEMELVDPGKEVTGFSFDFY